MKQQKIHWTQSKSLELLKLYQSHELLWNPNNSLYKHRGRRREVIMEIAKKLGVDSFEIDRKIKNITSHYLRELKRVEERRETDSDYKTKWFAFDAMQFLNERLHILTKKRNRYTNYLKSDTNTTQEENNEDDDDESSDYFLSDAEVQSTSHSIQNVYDVPIEDPLTNIPNETKTIIARESSRDEADVFGEYIAFKIRDMNTDMRNLLQYKINTLIFKAEMGLLTMDEK